MKPPIRSLLIFLTLIVVSLLAFSAQGAKRKKSAALAPSPSPSPAAVNAASLPNCTSPGVLVLSDPANDQLGNQGGQNQQLDFTAIYFAELGTDSHTLTVTMKVQNLSGTLTPNATWQVYLNVNDTTGTLRTIFVNMNTTDNPPNAAFNFGYNSSVGGTGNDTSQGTPGVVTGSFSTDGTITIIAPKSAFGSPQPGDLLGAIGGRTLTGDTSNCATDLPPCTLESKLERSNAFVDHTFVKAQSDNSYPAATYTLAGNVPLVTVTASPTQIHETQSSVYTISISQSMSVPLNIRFSMGGNAIQKTDYTLSSQNVVVIPAGKTSATVTLNSLEEVDPVDEPNSTAILKLQPGTNYAVGTPSSATVTILP